MYIFGNVIWIIWFIGLGCGLGIDVLIGFFWIVVWED